MASQILGSGQLTPRLKDQSAFGGQASCSYRIQSQDGRRSIRQIDTSCKRLQGGRSGVLQQQRQHRRHLLGTNDRSSRGPVIVRSYRPSTESNYYKAAPLTAWSPMRSLQSLGKFFVITTAATTTAWYSHPHLLNLAAHVLHLDFKDSVTAFQTSFFSFLSLVFAIYSGNTMAFLYDRQKEMVKNLYNECMALEELLEESVNALGPDARDILAQIRLYIDTEIYHPENQAPPLGEGFALSTIRSKARNYRRAGTDVAELLQASQRLAHAQSERQATACRLLPPVHWALLYTIGSLFVSTFILFETGGSFSNEGRHILFTVLCGLMSFVLCALRDLADPAEGVYNATALLEERLSYIKVMLDKYQKLPSSAQVPVAASLQAVGAQVSVPAGKEASAPKLLNSMVSAIKNVAAGEEGEIGEDRRSDAEQVSDKSSNGKGRPILEAQLQVVPEGAKGSSIPSGVTAIMTGATAKINGNKPLPSVPLPPASGGESGKKAGAGGNTGGLSRVTSMVVGSRNLGRANSAETLFKQQLEYMHLLREPVTRSAIPVARPSAVRGQATH